MLLMTVFPLPFYSPYLIILCVAVLILAVALGVTVVSTAAFHLKDRRRCCWKGEYTVNVPSME